MKALGSFTLIGSSGEKYDFVAYSYMTKFASGGAVYATTKRAKMPDDDFTHQLVYFGTTEDLATAFDMHDKEACFQEYDVDCICVHEDAEDSSRRYKVADLVDTYDPACNR